MVGSVCVGPGQCCDLRCWFRRRSVRLWSCFCIGMVAGLMQVAMPAAWFVKTAKETSKECRKIFRLRHDISCSSLWKSWRWPPGFLPGPVLSAVVQSTRIRNSRLSLVSRPFSIHAGAVTLALRSAFMGGSTLRHLHLLRLRPLGSYEFLPPLSSPAPLRLFVKLHGGYGLTSPCSKPRHALRCMRGDSSQSYH